MTEERFGWCFVGAGKITRRVLADLQHTNGAYIASVYARHFESAKALADACGAVPCHTLEEALAVPGVRAAYVATTNDMHAEHAITALRRGIPVLCEKPFAINLAQAGQMVDAARAEKTWLMEAMWTRLNPVIRQVLRWIEEGRIGQVRGVEASYTFPTPPEVTRMYSAAQGGGGLLDIGVYTVAFTQFIFGGMPLEVSAMGNLTATGVDSQCAVHLYYRGGGIARLFSGMEYYAAPDATVFGELGRIHVPHFALPKRATLYTGDGEETFAPGFPGEGFQYEFDAAMEDIRAGRLENALISHRYTLGVMEVLDEIRRQMDVRYPQDGIEDRTRS